MADLRNTKTVVNPLTDPESEFYTGDGYTSLLRHDIEREKRLNPIFPKAKYVFVHKFSESPNVFKIKGTLRRTRKYAIAILTDDNRYYYNEYTSKQTVLSMLGVANMTRIFLDGYIVNTDTRVMLDDSIKREGEPLALFMFLVARTAGIRVRRRSLDAILQSLDNMLRLNIKSKSGKVGRAQRQFVEMRMRSEGWLDFLPPALASDLRDRNVGRSRKKRVFFAAAGIMYLFRKEWSKNARDEKVLRKYRERFTAEPV